MKLVFLGSPGVGKGTYTKGVVEKYKLAHVSTGDIFRENIKNGTELGKKAKTFMDAGKLVPDEVTINMVKEHIKNIKGFVLDGFPRTITQAEALDKITKIDSVINFTADEKVILQRLSGRRICRKCGAVFHVTNIPPKKEGICDACQGELYQRDDDKPEAIKERLKVYENQTAPLIEYYKKKGMLKTIDANSPDIPKILKELFKVLEAKDY